MDGLHRRGFYNLFIKERPSDDSVRIRYEMIIIGNQLTLNVDNVIYETIQKDPKWHIEMKFKKGYTLLVKRGWHVFL